MKTFIMRETGYNEDGNRLEIINDSFSIIT